MKDGDHRDGLEEARRLVEEARRLVEEAILSCNGRPVGTRAADDPDGPAVHQYSGCFVRDFVVSAMVFLLEGRHDVVRNFLSTVVNLRDENRFRDGHELEPGLLPASFYLEPDGAGSTRIRADYGHLAIGHVAPVDSLMWWMILLHMYLRASDDQAFVASDICQRQMRDSLEMCLKARFEVLPTLLVPDGSFMIDRRMGVYGHPLEVQVLFYGMLDVALVHLADIPDNRRLLEAARQRRDHLREFVHQHYWLDMDVLNRIHRFGTEEIGESRANLLNVYPETIPEWLPDWLPPGGGYLVGNVGPGRIDFRFFALGNLLAVIFGMVPKSHAEALMTLYEERWDDLVGHMPVKLCYPAVNGVAWQLLTGSDPKNAPWSYHNGGHWPVLLWPFAGAALKAGRRDLAERAYAIAMERLPHDQWPEYYDGRRGRLIGRRANRSQTWSAAAVLIAQQLLEDPDRLSLLPYCEAGCPIF
jgi:hypothetical protein